MKYTKLKPELTKWQMLFQREKVKEYKRCSTNPIYFIRRHCKIINSNKDPIKFELYPFQNDILDLFQNNQNAFIYTSRQMGNTSLLCGYILWLMTFHYDRNIGYIVPKLKAGQHALDIIKCMWSYLPKEFQRKSINNSKSYLAFENGSSVDIKSHRSFGKSTSYGHIIFDTASYIHMDEIWIAHALDLEEPKQIIISTNAISSNSTTNGYLREIWKNALLGLNNFETLRVPWDEHPDRNIGWRKIQDKVLGKESAAIEYDAIEPKI